jgi:hypothetical protein
VAYPSGLVGQPGEFDNRTQGTPLLLASHRPQLLVIAPKKSSSVFFVFTLPVIEE